MDINIEFIINNKIEIDIENDGIYKSNIQDVTDNYIGISIPVNRGKYLPLGRKEEINVLYYYENDIYSFRSIVLGRKIDKILIIMIKRPESKNIKKVQRRNFVRVPFMINVLCAQTNSGKSIYNISNNQIDFFEAYSLDISGGGIRLALDKSLEEKIDYNDVLMLTIPLESGNLTVKAKVVRIEKDPKNPKIICGTNFVELDKFTREAIVKLVFSIMRVQMKNGIKEE